LFSVIGSFLSSLCVLSVYHSCDYLSIRKLLFASSPSLLALPPHLPSPSCVLLVYHGYDYLSIRKLLFAYATPGHRAHRAPGLPRPPRARATASPRARATAPTASPRARATAPTARPGYRAHRAPGLPRHRAHPPPRARWQARRGGIPRLSPYKCRAAHHPRKDFLL
jgi:hypothetical protein